MNNQLTEQEVIDLFKNEISCFVKKANECSKEIDLAVKCFFDENIEAVYPLNEKETKTLRERFGINEERQPKTLNEVSAIVGHSSGERSRQICRSSLRKIAWRINEIREKGLIDNELSENLQKLVFINQNVQSYNEYLTISNDGINDIQDVSISFVEEEQKIRNVKKALRIKDNCSPEYEIAIKLLLDKEFDAIYPLDEIQTRIIRERAGINDEMQPKTYEDIALIIGKSPSRIHVLFDKAMRNLDYRVKDVRELLLLSQLDLSEKTKKLIFANSELKFFDDYSKVIDKDEYRELKDKNLAIIKKENERITIDKLELSVRAVNCIRRRGITSVDELIKMTTEEVATIRNIGKSAYEEVVNKIHSLGFKFKDEQKEEGSPLTTTDNVETITQRRNELLTKGKQLTSERDALLQQESELDSRIASVVQNKENIQNGVQNGTTKK